LKISSSDNQSPSDVDTYVTPVTPTGQPGTFGAIEPAMAHVTSDFTIPLSEYKWNQVVELQLPDGKKVFLY
jgi:hypothetical protein